MRERARLPFPSEWFDDRGYFPGARIAPRSISASRISLDALSDLIADLGEVTSGTFIAGRLGQGRVIIGDQGDGIQMRDAAERTVMTMTTSGRLRIGYSDTPGIDMWDGLLDMHGGAIRAGTITADKMDVGELAAGMLRSDAILVGDGNPADLSTVTGVVITRDYLGGRNNGTPTVYFDPLTGHLVSFREDDATRLTYSDLAGGLLTLSNHYALSGSLDQALAAGVRWKSYVDNDITGGYDEDAVTMVGVRDALYLIRSNGSPALKFVDSMNTEYASVSSQGFSFTDNVVRMVFGRSLSNTDVDILLDTEGYPLRMGALGGAVIAAESNRFAVYGGYIALGQPWTAPTDTPSNMAYIWIDQETREFMAWDTTRVVRLVTEVI